MSLTNGLLARRPLDLPLYSQFASPLLLGDHLYGFDALDTLVCVDIRDGTAAWATNVAGATEAGVGEGGIIAADGKLIVVGDNGDLGILSASPAYDDGGRPFVRIVPRAEDEQWHTAPVLANGYIYCRSRHGTLACLRVGAPPGDQDEDGMADNWEQRHFGNTNNCAPDLDSDADSYRNSEEYIAGTDPTNRESRLSVRVEPLGDGVRVSWPARPADGVGYEGKARRYDLEQRASLVTGAWQAVAGRTNIPAVDGQLGHTDSDAASRRFYRVKARLEP
jgi:hypothetical protein